jgi:protein-tyrosine phosphatase/membrane-associated phospholipid phosphatase
MAPLSWRAGAVWTIVLGSTFFLVYGTCNWITSLRAGVPSFYWAWEPSIPFVPAMVVPYMSLDLFFAGAIFLCAREEIGTHAKRVFLAIFVAAACFLLFPLRFAFVRPATAGFAGMLFDWLKLDQPYNQFPSLHIALCSIVWAPYRRRSKGPLRWILAVWFLLIGLSPLLTYQHHAIDLIGGGILTVIVFYLFPWSVGQKSSSWQRGSFHFRATLIYGVPALLLTLIAFALRPWGLLLLWPACSLALVAAAYAGAGPQVFRKCDGVIPWAARVLLGPYLLGARISREAYRRTADVFGQVTPSLLLGGKLTSQEARHLVNIGVTAVLDLAPEYSEARELLGLKYESIQVLDWTVPTSAQLQRAVLFIDRESRTGKVYVHCALGFSRSTGVVAAYLLESSLASTAEEAVALIRKVRPQIVVTSGWMRLLRARMPVR